MIAKVATLAFLALLISAGFYSASGIVTRNSSVSPANSPIIASGSSSLSGDSEDYYSCLTYQGYVLNHLCPINGTISSVDASWAALIANLSSSPTDYASTYSWNTFKLEFSFQNLNTSDSSIHYLNLTLMDSVITTLHDAGFNVILSDDDWSNFGSATWVQDWVQVAQHYKGDNDIQAFDLYEEPDASTWSSNVTTTNPDSTESVDSAFYNATLAIRAVDPTRTVIWFLSTFTLNPAFTLSNVEYDFHLDANAPDNNEFGTIASAYDFSIEYGVTVVCLELNLVTRSGDNYNQTEAAISYMRQLGVGYFLWLYGEYSYAAMPILDNPYSGNSWITTTAYPDDLNGQSCLVSGPNSDPVLYCVGGAGSSGTDYNTAYYSTLNSGIYEYNVSDPWTSTTSYPTAAAYLKCALQTSTEYCVGGESDEGSISSVYSSTLSSTGIGSWTSQNDYPLSVSDEACVSASVGTTWQNLYCLGGNTGSGVTPAAFYASTLGGKVSSWSSTTSYPLALQGLSCVSDYVGGADGWAALCTGGKSGTSYYSNSYFAKLTSDGVGSWISTTAYPIATADLGCSLWNGSVYCSSGTISGGSPSDSAYYALVSLSGIGAWKPVTDYPQSVTAGDCAAASYWFYCLGGKTSSGSSVNSAYAIFLGSYPNIAAASTSSTTSSSPSTTSTTTTSVDDDTTTTRSTTSTTTTSSSPLPTTTSTTTSTSTVKSTSPSTSTSTTSETSSTTTKSTVTSSISTTPTTSSTTTSKTSTTSTTTSDSSSTSQAGSTTSTTSSPATKSVTTSDTSTTTQTITSTETVSTSTSLPETSTTTLGKTASTTTTLTTVTVTSTTSQTSSSVTGTTTNTDTTTPTATSYVNYCTVLYGSENCSTTATTTTSTTTLTTTETNPSGSGISTSATSSSYTSSSIVTSSKDSITSSTSYVNYCTILYNSGDCSTTTNTSSTTTTHEAAVLFPTNPQSPSSFTQGGSSAFETGVSTYIGALIIGLPFVLAIAMKRRKPGEKSLGWRE